MSKSNYSLCFSSINGIALLLYLYMIFGVPAISFAVDLSSTWDLDGLMNNEDEQVIVKDSHGEILKRIDRSQMLYLYTVKQSIERSAEERTHLRIIPGNSPNAMAGIFKGRKTVFVNFAMLDMVGKDMNQWAALIGHEIAHIKLQHQDKRLGRKIPLIIVQSIILSKSNTLLTELVTGLAMKGVTTVFSREDERDADYLGVVWAVEAGYDPMGAVTLQENLHRVSGTNTLPFLSTHPSGPERIRTLHDLADRLSVGEDD